MYAILWIGKIYARHWSGWIVNPMNIGSCGTNLHEQGM